jgi:hypothetical protein
MKMSIVSIVLLLQACAIPLGREIKQIKIQEDAFHHISIKKEHKVTREFESKSCAQIYVFYPTKLKANFEEILNNACKKDEYIINAQFTDETYYIPFFYGEECYILKGQCAKI